MKSVQSFVKNNKKFVITMAIVLIGNGLLYWLIKLFQSNPIYINHYLDDKIPFWGWMVYIYDMFYPFFVIAFFLLYKDDEKEYFKGIIALLIGVVFCNIIYLFMPTIMYRPVTPSYDPLTNLVLKITFFFDEPPLNCFPSLHCLFCFQEIISFIKSKCKTKRKIWVSCCAMLIILSTLFVKQHYIYDVLSALLIALIANALSSIFHLYDKFKKKRII